MSKIQTFIISEQIVFDSKSVFYSDKQLFKSSDANVLEV